MRLILQPLLVVAGIVLSSTAIQARELTPLERGSVERAVKDRLIDPDSAKFKHPQVDFPAGIVSGVYCGYVNSKNRIGGYNGDVQFMAVFTRKRIKPPLYEGDLIAIGDADPDSVANEVVRTQCEKDAPKVLVNSVIK